MNYLRLSEIVKSKGCTLVWSEAEYNEKYENTYTNIEIISICGHNTVVQVSNLIYKNTGIICKKCSYEKQSKDKECNLNDSSILEYRSIKAFEYYCKTTLKFKILVEGTLADFVIKPSNEISDLWLPIQIKTKSSFSHGIYSFNIQNDYKDMYVLLFCVEDQRIWLLNGNDIYIKRINIGHYNSIYNKYEVELCKLIETLIERYYNSNNFLKPLEELNIPISLQAQQEQEFKQYRESLLKNLNFNYPEINNRVFDCVVNDVYKVQDKVITIYYKKKSNKNENRSNESYVVHLCRRNCDGNIMYELGDNDFYWLSLPDKKGSYIIPEGVLFEKKLISNKGDQKKISMISLYPYHSKEKLENIKTAWLNDHLYFYDKDIEKINALFVPNDKPHVIVNDFIPLILIDKQVIKPIEDHSNLIKTLVSQIFKNVIENNIFKPKKIYECIDCKKQLNKSGITRCLDCSRLNSRKVERPSYIQLKKDLNESNYLQVGKKYGVSDNCVRKWIKYFEKSEDKKFN